ncbi:MAG TPA: glycosyltransferase [Candidatus Polarisedimenticolaceae bacterium]|nr:glycosyltransferase [Candidatus Polarisedimenticolaceae bacterium]
MGGPEIAVVIPTHQRRELVLRVLAALAAQRLEAARFEVSLVCDGCTDGTASEARGRYGPSQPRGLNLVVTEQACSGASAARNAGVARTTAPLLLFLDDDMIASPDLLQRHLRAHRIAPGGIAYGAVPVHQDSPRSFLSAGLAAWARRRDRQLRQAATVSPDEVLGGHLSVSRTVFDALGGFDPLFTGGGCFGGEDIDFGWRARLKGIPLRYLPQAVAHQLYTKTFRDLARDIRQAAVADVNLVRHHPELRSWLMLGRLDELGPLQRRFFQATLRGSALASLAGTAGVLVLEAASRWKRSGAALDLLHGLLRAHLYAAGLIEAGGIPAVVATPESAHALTA